MTYKKCEICGLKSERKYGQKRFFMARFPLDEVRCKQWVKISGKEDLAYVPIEKLHQLKFVCGKHFKDKDFKKKKTQLKRTAVPSLRLTAPLLSDEILTEFPYHVYSAASRSNEQYILGEDGTKTISPETKVESSSIVHSESNSEEVKLSDINDDSQVDVDASDDTESVENKDIRHHEPTGPFSWQKKPEIECFPDNDELICLDSDDQQKDILIDLDVNDDVNESTNDTHGVYKCNECREEIFGGRFTCAQCVDYDLCANCASERETHSDHYLLRVPPRRPPDEVQLVLQKIRELLEIENAHVTTLTTHTSGEDSELKVEVKEEKEDIEDPLDVEDTLATVPDIDDVLPLITQGSCDASNVQDNATEPVTIPQTLSRESLKRPCDSVHPFPLGKKTRSDTVKYRVVACAERVLQTPAGGSAFRDAVLSQQTCSDTVRHRVATCDERVPQPPAGGSALSARLPTVPESSQGHETNTSKHLFLQTLEKDKKVLINLKKVKILKLYAPKKS